MNLFILYIFFRNINNRIYFILILPNRIILHFSSVLYAVMYRINVA